MAIKIKQTIAWQMYEDVVYIFDDVNRETYTLTDVSAIIWKFIAQGYDFNKIVNVISDRYVIDKEVVLSDIKEFVNDLLECGLLEVSE
jgi:hypothetical protein